MLRLTPSLLVPRSCFTYTCSRLSAFLGHSPNLLDDCAKKNLVSGPPSPILYDVWNIPDPGTHEYQKWEEGFNDTVKKIAKIIEEYGEPEVQKTSEKSDTNNIQK